MRSIQVHFMKWFTGTQTTLWMLFILISILSLFPSCWPLRSIFSVMFQFGSVQSAGLWPQHAEGWASRRPSTTGSLGLFAQTVLHGHAAAPSFQQVSQPTLITAVSLNIPADILLLCPSHTLASMAAISFNYLNLVLFIKVQLCLLWQTWTLWLYWMLMKY